MKMSWLTRALLALLFMAVTGDKFFNEVCPKGYKTLENGLCAMVTPPGTWLEALSQCRLPNNFSGPSWLASSERYSIRHHLLEEERVLEWWDWPSDFPSVNTQFGKAENSIHAQLYSFHISRRTWPSDTTTECKTSKMHQQDFGERSCSPDDSNLKLPHLCISSYQIEHQIQELSIDDMCTYGVFQRFQFNEHNMCVQIDDEMNRLVAREWYPEDQNHSPCEFLAEGIERTELETRLSKACKLHDKTTTPTTGRTTTKDLFTVFLNSVVTTTKSTSADEDRNENTRKSEVLVSFPRAWPARLNTCLICAKSLVTRAPTPEPERVPPLSMHLRNEGVGRLNLTLLNFDSDQTKNFTCYADATLSDFDSPNYKMSTITIFPVNKTTNTRVIKLTKTVIEDSHFMRLRSNTQGNHISLYEVNATRLTEYSEGRLNDSMTFLTVLFEVPEGGNYWCVGIGSTHRLIYTEKVKVVLPDEDINDRYLVLVETPRNIDPDELDMNHFGIVFARNLNVSDANFELKKITRNELSYYLLYHVSLPRNHTIPVGKVPRRFKFPITRTKAMAKISSVRKYNSSCSTTALNSRQKVSMGSESTLTGRPGEVIPLNETGKSGVNAVLLCVWDVVDGAAWIEVIKGDSDWKTEWDSESQESRRPNVTMFTDDLEMMSRNPVKSDQLSDVTDIILNLLNTKGSPPEDYKDAWVLLDKILSDLSFDVNGTGVAKDVRTAEVAILVSDLRRSDPVVGISFTIYNGVDSVVEVRSNSSFERNSEVSVKLPKEITSKYQQLAFAVFSKVDHFHSTTSSNKIVSLIVDIVLSNKSNIGNEQIHHSTLFGETIEIFFKPPSNVPDSDRKCAFWDLEKTVWSEEGCTLDPSTNACRCNHLTHFAQIFTGSEERSDHHQKALEIISIVGCSLSLFGLLVIAITGIVFKAWRQEIGNQMLLNLTAALTLNLVAYLLVHFDVGSNSSIGCVFIGAVLHYSVLACFCWMLVISGLQLTRLLRPVGNTTSKLLLKSSLFGWGVPCVPVGTLLIISLVRSSSLYVRTSNNAMDVDRGFCYPTGVAYYASVLAPIACIMVVNLVAYVAIMLRLFSCCGWGKLKTGIQRHGLSDRVIALRRVRILVFLFFLFGLPATFSFLAEQHIFFEYLVCSTATLQGFVIFVYFFVVDNKSRSYWTKAFCQVHEKMDDKLTEMSSILKPSVDSNASECKSPLLSDNDPPRNDENGSCVRVRSSVSTAKFNQEEDPLRHRLSSQQYGMPLPPANLFSQSDTDSASNQVSFEHKSTITDIKPLDDFVNYFTEDEDNAIKCLKQSDRQWFE